MIKSILVSLLKSARYTHYFWPMALLRICLGIFYLNRIFVFSQKGFLKQPILIGGLFQGSLGLGATQFISHRWQLVAYSLTYLYLLLSWSLILGFCVRLTCFIGVAVTILILFLLKGNQDFYWIQLILLSCLGLASAGRSIGLDHYFYERQRSLFW